MTLRLALRVATELTWMVRLKNVAIPQKSKSAEVDLVFD